MVTMASPFTWQWDTSTLPDTQGANPSEEGLIENITIRVEAMDQEGLIGSDEISGVEVEIPHPQVEILEPMIERVFGIALRQGRFPPAPPELRGATLAVEYVSPVQRSQRLSEVRSIVETLTIVQGMAEADPSVADNIDLDEATRLIVRGHGAPPSILRSDRKVREIRAAQAKLAAENQMREDVVAGADVVNKLGALQRGGAPLQ